MKISWQTSAAIYRNCGYNLYGERRLIRVGSSRIGVVRFVDGIQPSSVRADSSMSRGKAELDVFDAVFVFPLDAAVKNEDVLVVEGVKLLVTQLHRRFGLRGKPGHLEVGAMKWPSA